MSTTQTPTLPTKELITNDDQIITDTFDALFGYKNFRNVMFAYTTSEITQFIQSYIFAFAYSHITQTQITNYLTDRKKLSDMFDHFKRITVGGEQHSNEWFVERNKRITASSIGTVIKNTQSNTYKKLLCEKFEPSVVRKFRGSPATIWGTMFEPVAREIYSQKNKVNVMEYGLIPHQKYEFIGASPDGVTDTGLLLEIKCPYSRNITNKIPKHYYEQVQHQLEVCDYNKCHYAEFVFGKDIDEQHWLESFKYDNTTIRGVILLFTLIDDNYQYHDEYEYSPLLETNTQFEQFVENDWINKTIKLKKSQIEEKEKQRQKQSKTGQSTFELVGIEQKKWSLESYNVKLVERSREWFADALPKMKDFMNKVNHYKTFKKPLEQFKRDTGFEYGKKKVTDEIPNELAF